VPRLNFFSFLWAKNGSPFLKADVGYGIAIKNTQKEQTKATGGINAGVALGYRLSTNRVMLDFTVGTRIQKGLNFKLPTTGFTSINYLIYRVFKGIKD